MNTTLKIIKINQDKYKFTVNFENSGREAVEFPIDKLKNSGERVGLNFEINDKQLDPVDFMVVSKKIYNSVLVKPEEGVSIEFIGTMEKRSEKYYYLSFKSASYQIFPGEKYKIWFSLNGYVSRPIEMVFDCELVK